MLPLEISMQFVPGMPCEKRNPSCVVGAGGYFWAKALFQRGVCVRLVKDVLLLFIVLLYFGGYLLNKYINTSLKK